MRKFLVGLVGAILISLVVGTWTEFNLYKHTLVVFMLLMGITLWVKSL